MPTAAVTEGAVLQGHIEAVGGKTLFGELLLQFIEHTDLLLQIFTPQHRTSKHHNLGLWLHLMQMQDKFAIRLLVEVDVVILGAQVVGAEVHTNHFGAELAVVPELRSVVEASVVVPFAHIVGIAAALAVVVAIHAYARTSRAVFLGVEHTAQQRSVGEIVVFGGVGKTAFTVQTLIAIATSDGIAHKLDAMLGSLGWCHQFSVALQNEATKFGTLGIALVAEVNAHGMGQCGGQTARKGNHRVGGGEIDFAYRQIIHSHHKIATAGLRLHRQPRTLKIGGNLHTGVHKAHTLRITEIHTTSVLNLLICRAHMHRSSSRNRKPSSQSPKNHLHHPNHFKIQGKYSTKKALKYGQKQKKKMPHTTKYQQKSDNNATIRELT